MYKDLGLVRPEYDHVNPTPPPDEVIDEINRGIRIENARNILRAQYPTTPRKGHLAWCETLEGMHAELVYTPWTDDAGTLSLYVGVESEPSVEKFFPGDPRNRIFQEVHPVSIDYETGCREAPVPVTKQEVTSVPVQEPEKEEPEPKEPIPEPTATVTFGSPSSRMISAGFWSWPIIVILGGKEIGRIIPLDNKALEHTAEGEVVVVCKTEYRRGPAGGWRTVHIFAPAGASFERRDPALQY